MSEILGKVIFQLVVIDYYFGIQCGGKLEISETFVSRPPVICKLVGSISEVCWRSAVLE